MAKARGKAVAKAKPAGKTGSTHWLLGLVCGLLLTLAAPIAVLAGLLLGPGLLALLLDTVPGKPTARPVLLLGLAASARPIDQLWRLGHGMDAALGLAADPSVLATAWAAQAAGWLVVEIAPLFIALVLEAAAKARGARLKAVRRQYEEAWDLGEGEE